MRITAATSSRPKCIERSRRSSGGSKPPAMSTATLASGSDLRARRRREMARDEGRGLARHAIERVPASSSLRPPSVLKRLASPARDQLYDATPGAGAVLYLLRFAPSPAV